MLDPLTWLTEHLRSIELLGGVAYPNFSGPRECRTHIKKAEGLSASTCLTTTDVRQIFESLLVLPHLGWTRQAIAASGLRGHSFHGLLADLARAIGPNPHLSFAIPPEIAMGFAAEDANELG
jgi:hypothetical protein